MSVDSSRSADRWGDVSGFGSLRSEHGLSRYKKGMVAAAVVLAVGTPLVCWWAFATDHETFGFGAGVIGLGALLYPLTEFNTLRLGRKVAVFEGGVVVVERGKRVALRWPDITGVSSNLWRVGSDRTNKVHQLWSAAGEAARLTDDLDRVDDVIEAVNREVQPRVFRDAAATVNRGGRWNFGAVAMDGQGLYLPEGQTVPWAQLERATVSQGKLVLVIRPEGELRVVACASIINLPALTAIIDNVTGAPLRR